MGSLKDTNFTFTPRYTINRFLVYLIVYSKMDTLDYNPFWFASFIFESKK